MLFNQIENFKKYILLNKLLKLSTLPNVRIILTKIHCKQIHVIFILICQSLLSKQGDWWQPKRTAYLSHFAIVLYLNNFENFVLFYIFLFMKDCWRNLSLNHSRKSDQKEFFFKISSWLSQEHFSIPSYIQYFLNMVLN